MENSLPAPDQYWSEPAEALLKTLDSTPQGLSDTQAEKRLEKIGPNELETKKKVSAIGLFLGQFKSPIILILLFATLVSAVLQDWVDAAIILLIVIGSAILSFIQEYSASNAAEKLRSRVTLKTVVLRSGQQQTIPSRELVPGDVILLSAGSLIPADGVVIEEKDFYVSQAILTGETFPVEKHPNPSPAQAGLSERTNVVFMGTSVRSGSAHALVVLTGKRTAFGQLAGRLALRPPETEFERGIRRVGYLLTEIMLFLVLGIFAINVLLNKPPLDSLLFSIALAVGLTPQLLPAIININLSRGSQNMAANGVIVRRLESIENFGSMDVLCTDKTGTITEGVVKLDSAFDAEGHDSPKVKQFAYLNASLQTGLSNPMDQAIVAAGSQNGNGVTKVDEIPYDFQRKRLSVVVSQETPGGILPTSPLLITKGALENILQVCTLMQAGDQELPLDATQLARIHQCYSDWSGQGFRVLGVAIKPVQAQTSSFSRADEKDMVFQGFLLFFDPPKAGVQETITNLSKMGVQLKIITGDNKLVAQHTAQAVGLPVDHLITGGELEQMRDPALLLAAEKATIFAEVDPNQKERIILALKKTSHVVGYMGDGINDAPALHSADVGISVENAVDVAKEAADFVLLKQDLAVLMRGIQEGRKTFANTLKYVFMATSANFGNMFSVAGASLFLPFLPMLPKQILLINFLTDLPEMTIAGDNVDSVFIDKPHRWDVSFIRRFMLLFGPLSSVFDFLTFGLLFILTAGFRGQNSAEIFRTGWFLESVLSASIVVFALRTRLPFWRSQPSRPMIIATIAVGLFALLIPYSPIAGLLGFSPLSPLYIVAMIAIVIFYLASAEAVKRWFFKRYLK